MCVCVCVCGGGGQINFCTALRWSFFVGGGKGVERGTLDKVCLYANFLLSAS